MPETTSYRGYRISIEPYEWGFLAHILEPLSDKRLTAASTSVLRALEKAFEVIDDLCGPRPL